MKRFSAPILIMGFAIGWALAALFWPSEARSVATPMPPAPAPQQWQPRTEVSWYGPGFYGNRFACANTPGLPDNYAYSTRGVAHRTLPCGTRIVLCHLRPGARRYLCVVVRVIDRGPYVRGRNLDATARTAQDLCGCRRPYTMTRNTTKWGILR